MTMTKNSENKYTHKYLVRIVYKSGVQVEAWFYELNLDFKGENRTASWKSVNHRPLFMNVDAIESIWQIKVVKISLFEQIRNWWFS